MQDNKFRLGEVKRAYQQLKHDLPIDLANQAQNFFVNSWRLQAWDGKTWQTPKRRIEGTPEYKYPKFKGLGRRTRATLVETGALRRDVSNSVRSARFELIRLVVDRVYAEAHNEGDPSRNLPQRKFMGDSPSLRKLQITKINTYISRVFK
jgi:hypothetical protein